jgi:hypothetical protein
MNKLRNFLYVVLAAALFFGSANFAFAQDQQGQGRRGGRGGGRRDQSGAQQPRPEGAQANPQGQRGDVSGRRGGNGARGNPAGAPGKSSTAPAKLTGPSTDEFFVISSIDRTHHALVLLRATQITATLDVEDKTQFVGEDNKPLKLTDFRTGDTIFVVYGKRSDGSLVAQHVRKGMMTMAELRKRYLPSLPVTANPRRQPGS